MSISSISGNSSLSALSSTTAVQGSQHHHRGGGVVDVAAKALGLSTDDLETELKSGKSLGDIADAQGVSRDDLAAALKAGAPADLQAASDVDSVINSMINQVGGPQPPGGHHGHHHSSASIDSTTSGVLGSSLTGAQQSTLDSLSSLLGTDSSSLMTALQSGTSLSDLLSSSTASTSDLAGILQDGLLFDAKA